MEAGLVGAVKVKDGLFIGDEFAAQDLEFVVANKVTHIVNCAARQVPNHWEPIGVRYLAFPWLDQDSQAQIDPRDEVLREVFAFAEKAANNGESVLIHGVRDLSKPLILAASYLMRKYRWAMFKSLEFLNSRVQNVHLSPSFIHQLGNFESRLSKSGLPPRSSDWTVSDFDDPEEALLQNTLLNARQAPVPPAYSSPKRSGDRVAWRDSGSGEAAKLTAAHPAANNPVEDGFVLLKSALKGGSGVTRVPLRPTGGRRIGKQKMEYLTDNTRYAKTVESALEYGSLRVDSRVRTDILSPTRPDAPRDPGPLSVKKLRAASADQRETELKPAVKRIIKAPVPGDFVSVAELKVRDTPTAAGRPGPVKLPASEMSKSAAVLSKAKRPVTAPIKRPPSPGARDQKARTLGQSKTTGKLQTRGWKV